MKLSDTIENFIKSMLGQDENEIELQRNELATYFGCSPSQINYVLATRFTQDHGYVIESRRGGGGCIRIFKVTHNSTYDLLYALDRRIGDYLTESEADRLIRQLETRGLITEDEGTLMRCALCARALSIPMPPAAKDALRAGILRSMLTGIAKNTARNQS